MKNKHKKIKKELIKFQNYIIYKTRIIDYCKHIIKKLRITKEDIKFMNEDFTYGLKLTPLFGYNIDYNNRDEVSKLLFERWFIKDHYYKLILGIIHLDRYQPEMFKKWMHLDGFKYHPKFETICIDKEKIFYTVIKKTLLYKIKKIIFKNPIKLKETQSN